MSKIPAVIDGLVATLTTALALAGVDQWGQAAPVRVIDGPLHASEFPAESVLVGDNGDDDDEADSATSERDWAGLGAKKRDESGQIQCCVVCQSGDTVFKPLRDRAFLILDLIEDSLTADPTVAGATGSPGQVFVTAGPLRQTLDSGAVVRIPFIVSFTGRIT